MELLKENYNQEEHGILKYGHDAYGNKLEAEEEYKILNKGEIIKEGDKPFDIYSGWLESSSAYFEIRNGHHANYRGGRWTCWERKI